MGIASVMDASLDPHKLTGAFQRIIYDNLYDTLFFDTMDGKPGMRFLTAWQAAPDGLSHTFTIRTNAKWHDGSPVTAQDVAESLNRILVVGMGAPTNRQRYKGAEVVSPNQVRLTTKEAWATRLPFFYIVPYEYLRRIGDLDGKANTFDKAPVGSGPFKFKEQRLQEGLSFTANKDYWGEGPFVQEVEVRLVADLIVRVAMLKTREADAIDGLAGILVEEVGRTPGLRVLRAAAIGDATIAFRDLTAPKAPKDSPFLDKRVRQALAYAIDKEGLKQSLWRNQFEPKYHFLVSSHLPGWRKVPDPYPFNLEKAKQLMKEAGYPNGFKTTIYSAVSPTVPLTPDTTEAVVSMWLKIGVEAQPIRLETGTYFGKVRDRSLGPLFTFPASVAGGDGDTIARGRFASDAAYMLYYDATTDELGRRQLLELDWDKRDAVFQEMNQYIMENAFVIQLLEASSFLAVTDRVVEYKLPPATPMFTALWTLKLKN